MWYSNCTVTRIKYPALVFALNRYNFAIYSHRPKYIALLVPDSRRATTRNINSMSRLYRGHHQKTIRTTNVSALFNTTYTRK